MSTVRTMSQSPLALAKEAFEAGKAALAPYSSHYSRHDFIQAQFFAILVLRQFFKMDYRGIAALLKDFSNLRELLELKKVPHFTAIQKAEQRLLKRGF